MNKLPERIVGSVMVEFAGALVLLLLLVFGITEIGRAIYQLNTLTKSVEAGARYMSRAIGIVTFNPEAGAPEEQCQVDTDKWNSASEHATNIILYGTEVSGSMSRLPEMSVTSISVTSHVDSALSHGGACVIKVSAQALFQSIFSGEQRELPLYGQEVKVGTPQGLILKANAEERYIGE